MKENPAIGFETQKSSRALATTYILTWHCRGTDSKEGDSLQEKFSFAFMVNIILTKNKTFRLGQFCSWAPLMLSNKPLTYLWIVSTSSIVALHESSHIIIPVPVFIFLFIIVVIITISFLSVNSFAHARPAVLSDLTFFSCFCVLCKFTSNKYRCLYNYKCLLQSSKPNTFIPTNDFTRLALCKMFLTSPVFKQTYTRTSLPLKDGLHLNYLRHTTAAF